MKKTLLLTILSILVLSSISFAVTKWSFGGSFSTNSFSTQPTLVVNFDDKYDLVAGYQTIAQGSGNDQASRLLLGGTMWTFKTGAISCGWSAYYLSNVFPSLGTKAEDNTLTAINIGFTAKTQLVSGVQLRADAILLSSVTGKSGAVDAGGSSICPSLQLSLLFDFM
jgi:hypothetical protein